MYVEKETILGICPIGKFVFSHEDAIVQKEKAAGDKVSPLLGTIAHLEYVTSPDEKNQ